ncbi:hypothetical protein D3C71_1400260 [compost metagenome]
MAPVGVGDVAEGLALVDADIVDEDIDQRFGLGDDRGTLGAGRVCQNACDLRSAGSFDGSDRAVELDAVAARDDNPRAFDGERAGDFEADAGGGAGYKGGLSVELQIHDVSPECCWRQFMI